MSREIWAYLIPPKGEIKFEKIPGTSEGFREIVGGDAETVPIKGTSSVFIVSRARGLEPNLRYGGEVLCGTIICCSVSDGRFTDARLGVGSLYHILDTGGIRK